MAQAVYRIERFLGIDQSTEENFLGSGYTPDACNMCTDDGNLSVAKGFARTSLLPVPGDAEIKRCIPFRHSNGDMYIVVAGNSIYAGFGGAWLELYTYPQDVDVDDFDFLEAKIGTSDYIIIGNGKTGLLKFDGQTVSEFGSEAMCSDRPVRYLAMYKNRLFAAGDSEHPNRLYWSKLPGDSRSIEDWGADEASPNVEGGHTQIGLFDNDPIVAITPLSSQLLIFKKNSLYRLYGDKPSNFTVEEIESVTESAAHTSIIHYGDVAYFMTQTGLYVFDGVSAHLMHDAKKIRDIMSRSDTSRTRGARTREKLYFTVRMDGEDAIIEYDLMRGTYMLRNGFEVRDIFSRDNGIYIMSDRYICKFNCGESYAGKPISAHWCTPLTDLNEKTVIKQLREIYLRCDDEKGKTLKLTTQAGNNTRDYIVKLSENEVTEIPLCDEGRCFNLKLENVAGESFGLRGGVEIALNLRGRCV
ncbi:MAG: hypothetical protein IJO93_06340 [Clostridia bacterium]|nr:hypothetical protein [Clostridia bacterium]